MSLKGKLTKSDYLPMSELKKLLDGLHKDKDYMGELYVRISFYTAMRSSDVRSLTWEEVLNRFHFFKTEKKTGKTRKITLSDSSVKHITELYKLLGSPDPHGYIFKNKSTGNPYTIQSVNMKIKKWKYKYAIKIGNFSTHTFRKTFGRYVYDSSEDKTAALVLLNQILRHGSLETTRVYLGIREDEINEIFRAITI